MDRTAKWLLLISLGAGVASLASCIDDDPPQVARVIVESSAAAPLTLIVSTNFLLRVNPETNRREAVPLTADTVYVTGSYDEQFDIDRFMRLYVLLQNDEPTPQRARLRVLLDGKVDYNAFDDLGNGRTLEYLFVSTSSF